MSALTDRYAAGATGPIQKLDFESGMPRACALASPPRKSPRSIRTCRPSWAKRNAPRSASPDASVPQGLLPGIPEPGDWQVRPPRGHGRLSFTGDGRFDTRGERVAG